MMCSTEAKWCTHSRVHNIQALGCWWAIGKTQHEALVQQQGWRNLQMTEALNGFKDGKRKFTFWGSGGDQVVGCMQPATDDRATWVGLPTPPRLGDWYVVDGDCSEGHCCTAPLVSREIY